MNNAPSQAPSQSTSHKSKLIPLLISVMTLTGCTMSSSKIMEIINQATPVNQQQQRLIDNVTAQVISQYQDCLTQPFIQQLRNQTYTAFYHSGLNKTILAGTRMGDTNAPVAINFSKLNRLNTLQPFVTREKILHEAAHNFSNGNQHIEMNLALKGAGHPYTMSFKPEYANRENGPTVLGELTQRWFTKTIPNSTLIDPAVQKAFAHIGNPLCIANKTMGK